MCFIKARPLLNPLKATKNITVYKLVKLRKRDLRYSFKSKKFRTLRYLKSCRSQFKTFKYIFGERYKIDKDLWEKSCNPESALVFYGYHSFSKRQVKKLYSEGERALDFSKSIVNQVNKLSPRFFIVECIIPKGAEYFKGKSTLVSNEIIVKGIANGIKKAS